MGPSRITKWRTHQVQELPVAVAVTVAEGVSGADSVDEDAAEAVVADEEGDVDGEKKMRRNGFP